MCGIVGLMTRDGEGLAADLAMMSGTVAHRGPDDSGTWMDESARVALGHRRLAVVDLSPHGHQPMVSADGRWVLTFNGEIYDHADHRAGLERRGIGFRGHSDTEVLLGMVMAHGVEGALRAVDGMFALALWDRARSELVLARDRMGEKPLCYGRVGGRFAFASELQALRLLPGAPTVPDPETVAEYVRLGYVAAPRTILPGIAKVPPGCVVRVAASGEAGRPVPYWSLPEVAARGSVESLDGLSDHDMVRQADDLLRSSLSRRLVADVPVGAFLSGGLDSSTVAAVAQAVSDRPIRTFTVAVGGAHDESRAASAVASHLGTHHTTLPLQDLDPLQLATGVGALYDEPFADPSAIPTALLCRAAREHVTVALSGDGADELLAGYNRYRIGEGVLGRVFALPVGARRVLAGGALSIGAASWNRASGRLPRVPPALGTKVHKLADALRADGPLDAFDTLAHQWDHSVLQEPSRWVNGSIARSHPTDGPLASMLLSDQLRTLPDDMLVKVDRASMAVALEVRVPFLDHRFVELTWRLPARAKLRDGRGKWLIRAVLEQYVPSALWNRPKTGFDPPLDEWLRGPLRTWAHDLLAPDRLRQQGLLRPDVVERALAEHDSGRRNHDYRLWTLLVLQDWLERPAVAP